jgi:hypothetical protein
MSILNKRATIAFVLVLAPSLALSSLCLSWLSRAHGQEASAAPQVKQETDEKAIRAEKSASGTSNAWLAKVNEGGDVSIYECDFPFSPQFASLNCSEPPLGMVRVFHFSPAWILAT